MVSDIEIWEAANVKPLIRAEWLRLIGDSSGVSARQIPTSVLDRAVEISDENIFQSWESDERTPRQAVKMWFDVDELPTFIWAWLEIAPDIPVPTALVDAARQSQNWDEDTERRLRGRTVGVGLGEKRAERLAALRAEKEMQKFRTSLFRQIHVRRHVRRRRK